MWDYCHHHGHDAVVPRPADPRQPGGCRPPRLRDPQGRHRAQRRRGPPRIDDALPHARAAARRGADRGGARAPGAAARRRAAPLFPHHGRRAPRARGRTAAAGTRAARRQAGARIEGAMTALVTLTMAAIRGLVRLYPGRFRSRFQAELLDSIRADLREASQRGAVATTAACARAFAEAAGGLVAEHRGRLRLPRLALDDDIRDGWRSLRQAPTFTAVALVVLAL